MAFLDCQQASTGAVEVGGDGLTLCAEPEVVVVLGGGDDLEALLPPLLLFLLPPPPPLPDNVNILIGCFRSAAAAAALPSSCQRCCSVILTALSHLPLSRNSGNEVNKRPLGRARNLWQLCLSSRTISQRTFPPRIITISTYRVELNGCTIAFALKSISSASKGPLKMEQQSGSSDGSPPQWGARASLFCPGGRDMKFHSFLRPKPSLPRHISHRSLS